METVLENCLARLPAARAVVCVSLSEPRVIGSCSLSDDPQDTDLQQLGRAAAEFFQSGFLAEDPSARSGTATEALVAGTDQALIVLRGRERADIAIAYSLDRSTDLGLALATSRLTIAEIEAVL